MATYTIYFLDERKVIVSFDFVECADDGEAWSHAPRLIRLRTDSRNVEIYEGGRRVAQPSDVAASRASLLSTCTDACVGE